MKKNYLFVFGIILGLLIPLGSMAQQGGGPPGDPPGGGNGSNLEARVAELEELVASLQSQLASHTHGHSDLNGTGANDHHVQYTNADAQAVVADVETDVSTLQSVFTGVSRFTNGLGYDTLRFEGMNVQIVQGPVCVDDPYLPGDDCEPDPEWCGPLPVGQQCPPLPPPLGEGVGNLIIGYNGLREDGTCVQRDNTNRRSGSHMLVLGDYNDYFGYGGIVAGLCNETSGSYASVSGGTLNKAVGNHSSVSGGIRNGAYGLNSSISGGDFNTAGGEYSSISGGGSNSASGQASSVSGGVASMASGVFSSVSGGYDNKAKGADSSISGGRENEALGLASSVSGGFQRETGDTNPENQYDWVAGELFEDQ